MDPAIQPRALCPLKAAEDKRAALQVVAEQTTARIPQVVSLVDSADHLAADLADSAALPLVMVVDLADSAALPPVMAADLEGIRAVMVVDLADSAALPLVMAVDLADSAARPLVMAVDLAGIRVVMAADKVDQVDLAALPLVMAVDKVDPVDPLVLAAARRHRSRDVQEAQSLRLGRCRRRLLHDLLNAKLLLQAKQKCTASRKMFRIACSRIPRRQ